MTPFHYSACPPATTTVSVLIRSGIGDKSELIKLQNKSHVTVIFIILKWHHHARIYNRNTILMMLVTKKKRFLLKLAAYSLYQVPSPISLFNLVCLDEKSWWFLLKQYFVTNCKRGVRGVLNIAKSTKRCWRCCVTFLKEKNIYPATLKIYAKPRIVVWQSDGDFIRVYS